MRGVEKGGLNSFILCLYEILKQKKELYVLDYKQASPSEP